ncbi:Alpha/Beta hydrolase protein, partial [Cladochytrium replicatum]
MIWKITTTRHMFRTRLPALCMVTLVHPVTVSTQMFASTKAADNAASAESMEPILISPTPKRASQLGLPRSRSSMLSFFDSSSQPSASPNVSSRSPPTFASPPPPSMVPHLMISSTKLPDSWSAPMRVLITTARKVLERNKDNIALARILSMTKYGRPYPPTATRITPVVIPRRQEGAPEGLPSDLSTGTLTAEWVEYRNPAVQANPSERVILFIHGGAYFMCSRKTHRPLTWKYAKLSGAKVFAIDYRLSPEYVFPAALHDAISAYMYLVDPPPITASQPPTPPVRYSPNQIIICGDSAGGNLATALLLWLRSNAKRLGLGMPAGGVLMSPWLDLTHSMPSFVLHGDVDLLPYASLDPKYITQNRSQYYVKDNTFLRNPLVSPKCHQNISNDITPLPPLLIQCGSSERLYHEILHFASTTLAQSPAPVTLEVYEHMTHVHQLLQWEPLARLAQESVGKFVIESSNTAVGLDAVWESQIWKRMVT